MWSAVMRLLVVFGTIALVGTGCGENDSVTATGAPEASAVADDVDVDPDDEADHGEADHDEADHDEADLDEAVADDEADHDDKADHDDASDHDDEADHDDAADHDDEADHGDADMVVEIVMSDFAFEMDDLVVPVGSTVRFEFVNDGAIEHEAMFGDTHQQEEFAELGDHADDHGDVGGHHGEVQAITLDAGGSGSLTVTFDGVGETMIGCHLPGHWDAGMSATIVVA